MARTAIQITWVDEDKKTLERLAAGRTEPRQTVERARIILGCLAGRRVTEIARECRTRPNTVIKWRARFAESGLKGLKDAPVQEPSGSTMRIFTTACWRPWKNLRRRAKPHGMVRRWQLRSRARRMRSGGCCARKAFACNASARGV